MLVKDGEVIIVSEFTGRMMPEGAGSRRPASGSGGKRGVKIERRNQTLADHNVSDIIFRMYEKLARHDRTAFNRGQ